MAMAGHQENPTSQWEIHIREVSNSDLASAAASYPIKTKEQDWTPIPIPSLRNVEKMPLHLSRG